MAKLKEGYVQVYTGNGKGKTTAAMGLAFRAAGDGMEVKVVQFLKSWKTGELESAKRFDNLEILRFEKVKGFTWELNEEELAQLKAEVRVGFDFVKGLVETRGCDILILDEVMASISGGFIGEDEIVELIEKKPKDMELILTGRNVPEKIMEKADLITEMREIKHYYRGDRILMNKNVIGVEISGIRKFYNEVVKFPEAISLTLGQPDFPVPEKVKEAMIRAIEEGKTTYTANAGIVELREEISSLLKNNFDIDFSKDEIIITVGGSEGLYAAMTALLNPGEKVLVPSIAYPAYESISKIIGCEVINYDLNEDFSVNIESLKEGIKQGGKLLVLSYPCNPTGALLSKKSRDELVEIIKENDILVLTDEIYSSLCFEEEYYSVAQCKDIKEKIIYVSGFSKMFSMTGLRIGYVACPKKIYDQIIKVHQYNSSCATSISQWGALEGLKSCMNDVENMKESFKERMNFTYKRLIDMGLEVEKPKGAFYIYPNISKFGLTSEEFCHRLLKEGKVACVPGDAFGKGGEGYIRISYCYSKDELERALDKLEAFVKTLKK